MVVMQKSRNQLHPCHLHSLLLIVCNVAFKIDAVEVCGSSPRSSSIPRERGALVLPVPNPSMLLFPQKGLNDFDIMVRQNSKEV